MQRYQIIATTPEGREVVPLTTTCEDVARSQLARLAALRPNTAPTLEAQHVAPWRKVELAYEVGERWAEEDRLGFAAACLYVEYARAVRRLCKACDRTIAERDLPFWQRMSRYEDALRHHVCEGE